MTARARAMARLVAEQVVEVLVERGLLRTPTPEERRAMEESSEDLLAVMRAKAQRNRTRG